MSNVDGSRRQSDAETELNEADVEAMSGGVMSAFVRATK